MFKADIMDTWKALNQPFMPHDLLWALTLLQVAAEQPQQANLGTELCVTL